MNKKLIAFSTLLLCNNLFAPSILKQPGTPRPVRATSASFSPGPSLSSHLIISESDSTPSYSHLNEIIGVFVAQLGRLLDTLQAEFQSPAQEDPEKIDGQIVEVGQLRDFMNEADPRLAHPLDKENLMLKVQQLGMEDGKSFANACEDAWCEHKIADIIASRRPNEKILAGMRQDLQLRRRELESFTLFPRGKQAEIAATKAAIDQLTASIEQLGEEITLAQELEAKVAIEEAHVLGY